MTANELRIGNWINTLEGISKVISTDYVKVRLHRLTEKGNFTVYDEAIEYIEPIPLTGEILLKCGFEEDILSFYKDDLGDVFLKKPYNSCDYFLVKSIRGSKITSVKYLHQLQNLYFALTGEELEVEL